MLHLLGALDRPSAGCVLIGGRPLEGMDDDAVSTLRNRTVGFVFQFHHLLREFTALENVMMPLRIAGIPDGDARARALSLLARVGLAGRVQHRPSELSGGEQQRTAVARALAIDPALLLADEPSGNLDHHNSELLHGLFAELVRELEIAMVVVTHNRSLAARADRVLQLEDGRLITRKLYEQLRDEELQKLGGEGQGRYRDARQILDGLVEGEFVDFLTLPAYGKLG